MTGVGLFMISLGYAIVYWGIQAIQGNPQGSFVSYLFPFGNG
jgi:hypothetical protein